MIDARTSISLSAAVRRDVTAAGVFAPPFTASDGRGFTTNRTSVPQKSTPEAVA